MESAFGTSPVFYAGSSAPPAAGVWQQMQALSRRPHGVSPNETLLRGLASEGAIMEEEEEEGGGAGAHPKRALQPMRASASPDASRESESDDEDMVAGDMEVDDEEMQVCARPLGSPHTITCLKDNADNAKLNTQQVFGFSAARQRVAAWTRKPNQVFRCLCMCMYLCKVTDSPTRALITCLRLDELTALVRSGSFTFDSWRAGRVLVRSVPNTASAPALHFPHSLRTTACPACQRGQM